MKKTYFIFAALCAAFCVTAALPKDVIIVEAESFSVESGWVVKKHFPNWYADSPSQGNFLSGHTSKPGKASKVVKLAAPGKYKLHLRYLDVLTFPAPFLLSVKQSGTVLAEKELNRKAQRADLAVQKKHGKGFARFMWHSLEFTAPEAGEIELELTKLSGGRLTAQGTRHLDLFLITGDLSYKPDIMDLNPLYVQIRMLDSQPNPAAVHVFGRLSRAPHYPPHMNINRKGLFVGAYKGLDGKKKDWLRAGESSPWINIAGYLTFHGWDRISFDTRQGYRKPDKAAAFEVLFSRTPDEKNIIKRFVRRGNGNGMLVSINLVKGIISCDLDESAANLKRAQATGNVPGGKKPVRYPFLTGVHLKEDMVSPAVMKNESTVLNILGINGTNGAFCRSAAAAKSFPFHTQTAFVFHYRNKCFLRPDTAGIGKLMKEQSALRTKIGREPLFINLMDEPEFPAEHVLSCKHCRAEFPVYLAANNAGVSGAPTLDKSKGALYYWTVRFRNDQITRFFKLATSEVAKNSPAMRTAANFAPDVTGGTSIGRGCDWFEIFNRGALTYGWHEDWANLSGTYQCMLFQNAVMRAACRKSGIPYGIYNILCRTPQEVEAKGFSAIGQGNSAMHFFSYGPHYANASDTNSSRPEIYQAIKNITYATGKVEDTLVAARPVTADAAMLLSRTGDIWNFKTDNMFGKERVFLTLLLRHCNYSVDVVHEDDIATQLKSYKVLFAVDSHIRRSQLKYILDWVSAGNTLYLGANALMFDENNKPLKWNIPRKKFTKLHKVNRGHDGFVRASRKNKRFRKMSVIGGEQLPFNAVHKFGSGRIICSGFFPGLSYMHESKRAGKIYSIRNYPLSHRDYIASLKLPEPKVKSSNYRVEAHLLESPDKYLIVLANWSGKTCPVTVTFNGKKYTRTISGGGYIEINK
ncbi:MAG: hypothetical protein IJY46_07850 [Lentisphaeria bacterium]|nr:hypothetical protein [Lentisphaeria bacterium]